MIRKPSKAVAKYLDRWENALCEEPNALDNVALFIMALLRSLVDLDHAEYIASNAGLYREAAAIRQAMFTLEALLGQGLIPHQEYLEAERRADDEERRTHAFADLRAALHRYMKADEKIWKRRRSQIP